MDNNCWLPSLEPYNKYGSDWTAYENALYKIFSDDFIQDKPYFYDMPVNIRKHPIEFGKEEAFFHVTCSHGKDYKDREPDFRRCERIRWVRAFIDNYDCDPDLCENCDGIKLWKQDYHGKNRFFFLFEEERYVVIIEERDEYYLLITAYYVDYDHSLRKLLKEYDKYCSNGS